jgi:hypothetical protein
VIAFALLAALAVAAPRPGELKTIRDWTVGCDNGRACQAVALLPEDGADGATLAVRRGAEAGAVPELWLTIRSESGAAPAFLAVDGRRVALAPAGDGDSFRVRDAGAAFLLGQATRIELLDRAGNVVAPVSTRGSAGALLYMDEQQRRLGTTGALVRRGPASRVPPPPALPVITSPAPTANPPRTLGPARVRQLLGRETTTCEYANELDIESARLDARHSLLLASHPCGNGAYNLFSSAWIVDEAGHPRPAAFDASGGMGEGDDMLVNAGWDAKARRLTTFSKGRGLGDCGVGQAYVWDGTRFRLVHQEAMGECRGSTDYITTWRAKVRRPSRR